MVSIAPMDFMNSFFSVKLAHACIFTFCKDKVSFIMFVTTKKSQRQNQEKRSFEVSPGQVFPSSVA